MADGRRIAVFLDGTWNTVNDNTNVYRLKSLCAAPYSEQPLVRVFLVPAVTFGAPMALQYWHLGPG